MTDHTDDQLTEVHPIPIGPPVLETMYHVFSGQQTYATFWQSMDAHKYARTISKQMWTNGRTVSVSRDGRTDHTVDYREGKRLDN